MALTSEQTAPTPRQIMNLIGAFSGQRNSITIKKSLLLLLKRHTEAEREEAGKGTAEVRANYPAAVLLDQLLFWTPKSKDAEGWIYKTLDEWAEETLLTRSQIRTAFEELKAVGVETMSRRIKLPGGGIGDKCGHYRINWGIFYPLLQAAVDELGDGGPGQLPMPDMPPEAPQTPPEERKGRKGQQSTPKAPKRSQEEIANDPVEVLRGLVGRYPNKEAHDVIRQTVKDVERWRKTLQAAAAAGKYLLNIPYMLKLYQSGELLPAEERAAAAAPKGRQIRPDAADTMADWVNRW